MCHFPTLRWCTQYHKNGVDGETHFMEDKVIKSSLPGQNGRHFADDISKCIFVNETFCNLIQISLQFVPKGLIDNNLECV